jgi:proteic killer suppression protein
MSSGSSPWDAWLQLLARIAQDLADTAEEPIASSIMELHGLGAEIWRGVDTCLGYDCCMIQSFNNAGTEDIFNGKDTRAARRTCPQTLWRIATRKLDQMDVVTTLDELRIPPGNRLEALSGDRQGQHSIRVNDQYRGCFIWTSSGPADVEIVDYH